MSCCYCITRASSITACVNYSFQAKNVLNNSVFLHYPFFFKPEEHIPSSFHTDVLHTPILYTCSQSLELRLSPISFLPREQGVKLRASRANLGLGSTNTSALTCFLAATTKTSSPACYSLDGFYPKLSRS